MKVRSNLLFLITVFIFVTIMIAKFLKVNILTNHCLDMDREINEEEEKINKLKMQMSFEKLSLSNHT